MSPAPVLAFGMEFQPPKYAHQTAQCVACGDACRCLKGGRSGADLLQGMMFHRHLSDQASKWVLFGYRESSVRPVCLCVGCYFTHVDLRARLCPEFAAITEAEIDEHAALMGKGVHPLPEGEADKDRCLRLIVLSRGRQKFYGRTFLHDHIAEDFRLEPSELFRETVEPAYNRVKEAVVEKILHVRAAARMRRLFTSRPALIAYAFGRHPGSGHLSIVGLNG